MIAYKVVKVLPDGKYVSDIVSRDSNNEDGPGKLIYTLEEVTAAPDNTPGIFCFSRLDRALSWQGFLGLVVNEEILVVEGYDQQPDVDEVDDRCAFPCWLSSIPEEHSLYLPSYTVLFRSVKPVRLAAKR